MQCPPNVRPVIDRHGKMRYRFRKTGLASRYLPEPTSNLFEEAYAAALNPNTPRPNKRQRPKRHSRTASLWRPRDFARTQVVYFVQGPRGYVKIGTTRDLIGRLKKLRTGSPYNIRILAIVAGGEDLERAYHSRFAEHRIRGEWFKCGDAIAEEIRRLTSERFGQPAKQQF